MHCYFLLLHKIYPTAIINSHGAYLKDLAYSQGYAYSTHTLCYAKIMAVVAQALLSNLCYS